LRTASVLALLALALALALALVALPACGGGSSFSGSNTTPAPTGTFTNVLDPTEAAVRELHTATRLSQNAETLICGGRDAAQFLATAEVYAEIGDTFTAVGPLATARARHTATLLPDGTVLVAGGGTQGGVTASAELFDPVMRAFRPASSPLLAARQNHVAIRVDDGSVFVFGGDDGGAAVFAGVERYVIGGGFQGAGALQTARSRLTATFLDGPGDDVLVAGGFTATGPTAVVELYSPTLRTSRILAEPLRVARANHAAVRLGDGRVLIIGGTDAAGQPLTHCEVYDPRNERSTPLQVGLATARATPRASTLLDGRVLVTGNAQTAEIFDLSTSTFGPAGGQLMFARTNHTQIPLTGPETLIVGGLAAGRTAELFTE